MDAGAGSGHCLDERRPLRDKNGVPLTRAENMARIRGSNTAPERVLRAALWASGLRYRLQHTTPCGRADIVFARAKVAVFVDGCFWHGCPIHYVRPRTRDEFWRAKLAANTARDRRQTLILEATGWTVVRAWEHEVFESLAAIVDCVERAVCRATARQVRTARADGERIDTDAWRVVRVDVVDRSRDLERWHLESLRDPSLLRVEERMRWTGKWRRGGSRAQGSWQVKVTPRSM